jgi:hypothetical protein
MRAYTKVNVGVPPKTHSQKANLYLTAKLIIIHPHLNPLPSRERNLYQKTILKRAAVLKCTGESAISPSSFDELRTGS